MNITRGQFFPRTLRPFRSQGFTLIELMITVAIVGILAAVALPSYSDYIRRGQIQEAFGALSDYRAKMEQYYQDNRNYGSAAACASDPTASTWSGLPPTEYFSFSCITNTTGGDTLQQSYTLTATGRAGRAINHIYTINQSGDRRTTEFKGVVVTAQCWLSRNSTC